MRIWRIEDENGHGYFSYDRERKINDCYNTLLHSGGCMPGPSGDRSVEEDTELSKWAKVEHHKPGHRGMAVASLATCPWICGMMNMEQLWNWFSKERLEKYKTGVDTDFYLAVYEVDREHVKIGIRQVMFDTAKARRIARLELGVPMTVEYLNPTEHTSVEPMLSALVQRVIQTVDAGLSSGLGSPKPGNMCVEAAVCYALGLPHGDDPKCVDPIILQLKISLNDSFWSTKQARADGLRRLAVLQLGTKDNFDNKEFMKRVALMIIQTILPISLTAANLPTHAAACAAATTLEEGVEASNAASAASYAVRCAARAVCDAASYAARDAVLKTYATGIENILIEMNVPAVKYLDLLK